MRKRDAAKLHSRDQVEVRTDAGWVPAVILTDPWVTKDGVYFDVTTHDYGFIGDVRHTDVR
jgi:hypothetical protein